MSNRYTGKRYEDGTPKIAYFRITKHHRIKRNGWTKLRWVTYKAKSWINHCNYEKKYLNF